MKETTNMKAVVVETPGMLVVKEIPLDPMPGPGQVQIRLRAAGICGSDVHVLHGRSAFASYPRILGHELAGEVCALGEGVQGLALGDHVVIDPLTACGHCYACRVGRYNVCRELKVLAAHVDGGFRQFFTVRAANVHKISPSVPWEHAACVEPYTIAAEATQRGELRADVRSLSGAFAGRTLVSFYLDNDALRAVDAERMQLHACAVEAVTAALILYAAFTLLLAVWVFRDARRRDFLPAMWGLLTLIGNVVAWLVYMLVRSRGVGSRCPRCGTALRMGFAYCPACGAQVRRSCPACGHAAEDGWKVCPYCGRELPAPPADNAV